MSIYDTAHKDGNVLSMLRRIRLQIGKLLGAEGMNGRVTITPANRVTILRIVLVPMYLLAFFSGRLNWTTAATLMFVLGAISDLYDGKLARKHGHVTPFGNFMDPLADKLLVLPAFWALLFFESLHTHLSLGIVSITLLTIRELGLTFLRVNAIEKGSTIKTSYWGKLKTTIHLTTLILIMVLYNLRDWLDIYGVNTNIFSSNYFYWLVEVIFLLSMIVSVLSGIIYLKDMRSATEPAE